MRRAYECAGLFLLATLASSCTVDSASRERNRTLVVALPADPGHLNSAITTSGGVHAAADLLYDGLVELDPDQQPQPALASRWEVAEGAALYRFHLRTDVRWHDGQPFTAADVEYTFREVLLRFHSRTRASLEPVLESVVALDDSTVEFRFSRPYAPLLSQLDVVEAPILPAHIYAGTDPLQNPANSAPVGTGPFRFVSYIPDSEIRFARNEAYFRGAPPLEAVVLRVIPSPSTQVLALEAGEVDWLFGVPGPDRQRLRENADLVFLETTVNPGGSNCVTTVAFNLDRPVVGDVRTRRALARAVDRRMLLERVLFGEGEIASAPISSRLSVAAAPDLPLPSYDTTAAAALLEEAGWLRGSDGMRVARNVAGTADGTRLVIGLKLFPSFQKYGEFMRAQMRALGVELRLEALEPAVFVEAVFTRRDFDTAIISYCNGNDPQIGVRRQYATSSIAAVPFSNAAGYSNPEVDSLFEVAAATVDFEMRRYLYRRIQEIAIRDLPYFWLTESYATHAHRKRCTGFARSPHFAATARCGS